MADDDLIRRSDAVAALLKAQIASCTCETKTPEPDWHRETCRYRILREAEAMIHHVSPAPLAAALAVPEVRALVEAARLLRSCPHVSERDMEADWLEPETEEAVCQVDAALAALKGPDNA